MENKFPAKKPQEIKSFEWEKGSNQIFEARGLDNHERLLGFQAKDLVGKKVLDLGSHKDETFERDLMYRKIESQVISFQG